MQVNSGCDVDCVMRSCSLEDIGTEWFIADPDDGNAKEEEQTSGCYGYCPVDNGCGWASLASFGGTDGLRALITRGAPGDLARLSLQRDVVYSEGRHGLMLLGCRQHVSIFIPLNDRQERAVRTMLANARQTRLGPINKASASLF